ncbi:MAG TPA: NAD(P)-dependent oxidoreductase [Candidatus Woesearchaeota archaeon]|nr:NAD(P)-dependent oxidoreductase [Candidatus Woesearchaeota archaeon]
MANLKIGITGHDGFFGSHLLKKIKEEFLGTELSLFDMARYNLLDKNSLKDFVEGCDVVIHLAGINRGEEKEFLDINAIGTYNLASAIKEWNKSAQLIFSSSVQVYRPSSKKVYTEKNLPKPASIYGISKRFGEKLIEYLGINHTIFRFTNIYGENARPNYNSVVATFIHNAINEKPISVNCSLDKRISFLHVKDASSVIIDAIRSPQKGIFNVSNPQIVSMKDFLDILKQEFSSLEINIKKSSDKKTILTDSSLANKKFGWQPKHFFKEGISKVIEFHKQEGY